MKETHPQWSSLQEPICFARKSKKKIIFQGHGINLSLNNNNKNAVKKKKLDLYLEINLLKRYFHSYHIFIQIKLFFSEILNKFK